MVAMVSLRKIRSFVAVFEEGSFTAAAAREGATQSGISQQVKQLEESLNAILLVRDGRSVEATVAGRLYYEECVTILRRLDHANQEIAATGLHGGEVSVGLMPTFTRGVLPPVLRRFMQEYPGTEVRITEAYSGVLTDLVRKGELDFAVVPGLPGAVGLATTLLLRDREMLVSAKGRTGRHGEPVRLAETGPLKIVLPGHQNTRRRNIETYLATNGVEVAQRLELDAMMGTLAFVRNSDWVAILSSVIMVDDFGGERYEIRRLERPPLDIDFVLIEPARRALRPAARLFADILRAESERAVAARSWD
jgi:LysR family transcriptional regulator, nitrogen assimilation regulatory protein